MNILNIFKSKNKNNLKIITGSDSKFPSRNKTSTILKDFCDILRVDFENYTLDMSKYYNGISPSWLKLYAVLDSFKTHDYVMWVDADIVVTRHAFEYSDFIDRDISSFIKSDYIQAMVCHCIKNRLVPNMGLFIYKRDMLKYIGKYLLYLSIDSFNKKWYEQKPANLELGFNVVNNDWRLVNPTDLFFKTMWLTSIYNSVYENKPQNLKYNDLYSYEKMMFPEGYIPENGSEHAFFTHVFNDVPNRHNVIENL